MTTEKELEGVTALDRRAFVKKAVEGVVGGALLFLLPITEAWSGEGWPLPHDGGGAGKRYCFLIDIIACIGCGACCVADRRVYQVEGSLRTWVERYCLDARGRVSIDLIDVPGGREKADPAPSRVQPVFFVPKLCRMCREASCLAACPTGATYRSQEGLVLVDSGRCTGCASCVAACPHSARSLNPQTGKVEKCSWCHERLREGLAPACVTACPVQARKLVVVNASNSGPGEILEDLGISSFELAEDLQQPALLYLGWRKEVA